MALMHTILALVLKQPQSGYGVAKELAEGFGSCFWKASQQQVYTELAKLERQGSIIYSISEKGKSELIDWLMKPTEPTVIREDLGVIGLAGHLIPVKLVIQELTRRRQIHSEILNEMHNLDNHFETDLRTLELKDLYMHLVIRRAIRYQEDWVRWCEEAIQAIASHESIQ
jgi:DNA-binding PadR family transcriptional regulator